VQKKESSESSTKAALAQALSSLTSQAESAEAKSAEVASSAARVSAEVRALLPAVEFLFHTLAAGEAVAGPADSASAVAPSKTSSSLKMYNSPALQMAVREQTPPTASLLPSFMGILENRAADVVQLYAAKLSAGQIKDGGEEFDADAAEEEAARDDDAALKAAAASAEGLVEASAPAAAAKAEEAPLPELPSKRFISPAALGPSKPMGGLKESLTTSALVAAMSATATTGVAAGGEGGAGAAGGAAGGTRRGATATMPSMRRGAAEEEEEEAAGKLTVIRPYTLDELKRQAVASITADRSVPAIKSAATSAAAFLGRGSA
jgi:hypothetical protein